MHFIIGQVFSQKLNYYPNWVVVLFLDVYLDESPRDRMRSRMPFFPKFCLIGKRGQRRERSDRRRSKADALRPNPQTTIVTNIPIDKAFGLRSEYSLWRGSPFFIARPEYFLCNYLRGTDIELKDKKSLYFR